MMLQTMIVKNGLIRINDQYARNPRQTIRTANSKSSPFDALSFGDRSASFTAGLLCKLSVDTAEQIGERHAPIEPTDLFTDAFGAQEIAYVSTRSDDTQGYAVARKLEVQHA